MKVKVQLEQIKSEDEEGNKQAAAEEEAVISSPGSASPVAATVGGRRDAVRTSVDNRHRSKSRGKRESPDNTCSSSIKSEASKPVQETIEATAGKMINRNSERMLQIKGTGKVLQGKTETNGVVVPNHRSRDPHTKEDGKLTKKRKPVTVDTSKAKTSLEALKVSIRQLKWKEVFKQVPVHNNQCNNNYYFVFIRLGASYLAIIYCYTAPANVYCFDTVLIQ